jgi:outer membrane protein assembly complex protein YaeT
MGFLKPEASLKELHFNPQQAKVTVTFAIDEGVRYKVGGIFFKDNETFTAKQLEKVIGFKSDQYFSPVKFKAASAALRSYYMQEGFARASITAEIIPDLFEQEIYIYFTIAENRRGFIRDIVIVGNRRTKQYIIRRALAFKTGDTLYNRAINKTRKNLYDLGIFEQVEIVPIQIFAISGRDTENLQHYRMEVRVVEQAPYRLKYGFQVKTTDEGDRFLSVGGTAQLSNYNLLGRAHYADLILGFGDRERKAIGYLGTPYFFEKKIDSQLFAQYLYEEESAFKLETFKLGLQQKIDAGKYLSFSYGYNLSWNRQEGVREEPGEEIYRYRVGRLEGSIRYDSRNNIMDAVSGSYHNYSLGLANKIFGGQVNYIRFSGHYSWYEKVGPFTYAGAVRLGLIKDFGIDVPRAEKFFAGGGTTIRGFAQDKAGPLDSERNALGGNALFILNQELRLRFSKLLGGVVFVDIGSAFAEPGDFAFKDLRESVGVGIRFYTPYVLVRFDWGFKLDRRVGESPYTFFLSIGQTF